MSKSSFMSSRHYKYFTKKGFCVEEVSRKTKKFLKKAILEGYLPVIEDRGISREVYNRKVPEGINDVLAFKIKSRVMVLEGGSQALHLLGDIGRAEDDLISVRAEDEHFYIGNFCEGFGFYDVHFPKENVRPMTREEVDKLNRTYYTISGKVLGKNHYDYDGYWIG
ncbi:hypothetical protein D3C73_278360 [compost metagenome]